MAGESKKKKQGKRSHILTYKKLVWESFLKLKELDEVWACW